ncbi:MAG: hypothetical protein QM704_24880 [Anaeromyxobacteraceae bacterium]
MSFAPWGGARRAPRKHGIAAFLATALAVAGPAYAQAPQPGAAPAAVPAQEVRRVGLLLRMVLDVGGEQLGVVSYSDGSKAKLRAGQLGTFAAGFLYRAEAPWALEATFGYKFDQANASNGSVKFTRLPVDVIASYALDRHRFGVGPTLHLSPKYSCTFGATECQGVREVKFDTAVGGIAQYAFQLPRGSSGYELGARFTVVKYKASGALLELDGKSFGFFFGGWL